ncbi:MAG TPA: XRE family transcriptional regulator [Spirochaetaceae bacterium]|nr:XRE family transcriptional regulator [Spirochaetaceae bacterium]
MKYRFGDKVRTVREKRGLTLREVAEKVGVSESMVSQIERNRVSPAIDTLLALADALDIDLEYLFADYRRERSVHIVKAKNRATFSKPGVLYQRLAQLEGLVPGMDGIEAYQIELEPGAKTGSDQYGHVGSELGLVVEGHAELTVGRQSYSLESGDSAGFASDFPHILRNVGEKPLRLFWVITPPKNEISTRS